MLDESQQVPSPEISHGQFVVLVPDPARIHIETLAMRAAGVRGKHLREASLPVGLFTNFKGEVEYPRDEIKLSGDLDYNGLHAQSTYWSEQDAQALQKILQDNARGRRIRASSTTYDGIENPCWVVNISHPEEDILTRVALWHTSEQNHWKEQVNLISQHRSAYPKYANLSWDKHQQIIDSDPLKKPLTNSGPIITTSTLLLKNAPKVDDETAFKKYLEVFRGDLEDVVRGMARVKQIPQSGTLYIR